MPVQKTFEIVDGKIAVNKLTVYNEPIRQEFDYEFLLSQREQITLQAQEYASARQRELDEVNELIAKYEQLTMEVKNGEETDGSTDGTENTKNVFAYLHTYI